MASFKIIFSLVLVAALRIEAGVLPALAPAVAAPVAYTKVVPYNVPPFASSISVYGNTLGLPIAAYSAPLFHKAVGPAVFPPAPLATVPYAASPLLPPPGFAAPVPQAPLVPTPFAAAPFTPAPLAPAPAPLPAAPLAPAPLGHLPPAPIAAKSMPYAGFAAPFPGFASPYSAIAPAPLFG